MEKKIYLGRFGKVHGPFNEKEMDALQASGQLAEYTWIWDVIHLSWKPIDPPPPPLDSIPTGPSPMELGFTPTRGQVSAICHDFRQVVSGMARRLTSTGCEVLTEDHRLSPPFVARASVILNLLDAESGKLMNISGRVSGLTRSDSGWMFQVRWEQHTAA